MLIKFGGKYERQGTLCYETTAWHDILVSITAITNTLILWLYCLSSNVFIIKV